MAYEIPSFYVGVFPADINMNTETGEYYNYQYTGVCVYTAVSTQGTGIGGAAVIPPSATSSPIIGVLQNNPQQGEAAQVMVSGVTKAQAGGAFQIGSLLMVNSAGQFIAWVSGSGYAVAQALETAANGDITTVLLVRNGKT
jgi:Uncharacterized conserved protein (DUF2190)